VKRWRTVQTDAQAAAALAAATGLPRPLAALLASRGHATAEAVERFRRPRLAELSDPAALPNMPQAVARVWRALERGERIVVHGDYDADGVTSAALLLRVLRRLGGQAEGFLPRRIEDGYGLSPDTARRCTEELRAGLIVTVDCGSGAADAVRAAAAAGVDVVVTDHHELAGAPAPAAALVNPKLDADPALHTLAGIGVAFKFCHALLKEGRSRGCPAAAEIDLRDYLDLVAIGTIADVAPLTGENRALVSHGLQRLPATRNPGLRALLAQTGLSGELSPYHVAFVLGPRLNAAGRIGSAEAALGLLLTEDDDEARQLAERLERDNAERRRIEDGIRQEAEAELDAGFDARAHFGLVAARAGWHPGAIGIVASRLCAKYYRPAVVIALQPDGRGRGSARSIPAVHLLAALHDCADLLENYGGHAAAAGLQIRAEHLEAFRRRFNEACAQRLTPADLTPVQDVDVWLTLGDVNEKLWQEMRALRPFGYGNPEPVWGVRGVRAVGTPRRLGENGAHLALTLSDGTVQCDAIGFNLGGATLPSGKLDVLFHLDKNTFRDKTSLRLKLQDFAAPGVQPG